VNDGQTLPYRLGKVCRLSTENSRILCNALRSAIIADTDGASLWHQTRAVTKFNRLWVLASSAIEFE
jgi:hypothetical protein